MHTPTLHYHELTHLEEVLWLSTHAPHYPMSLFSQGDFALDINIDALIDQVDTDGSGEIEYEEFKRLLTKQEEAF